MLLELLGQAGTGTDNVIGARVPQAARMHICVHGKRKKALHIGAGSTNS